MKINKITDIVVYATDGTQIELGDTVMFNTNDGRCYVGGYNGLNRRGAVELMDLISHNYYGVMPKSIKAIYKVNVELANLPFGDMPSSSEEV